MPDITVNETIVFDVPNMAMYPLQNDHDEDERIRKLWNDTMKGAPKPYKYQKTAVLMLSWEDSDLQTDPEVCKPQDFHVLFSKLILIG